MDRTVPPMLFKIAFLTWCFLGLQIMFSICKKPTSSEWRKPQCRVCSWKYRQTFFLDPLRTECILPAFFFFLFFKALVLEILRIAVTAFSESKMYQASINNSSQINYQQHSWHAQSFLVMRYRDPKYVFKMIASVCTDITTSSPSDCCAVYIRKWFCYIGCKVLSFILSVFINITELSPGDVLPVLNLLQFIWVLSKTKIMQLT